MILELTDITGKDRATAHVALPEGATLNDVFEADEKLRKAFERQDCRAIPRADIWIYRHRGSVCRERGLAEPGEALDMTADCFCRIGDLTEYTAMIDGSSLNS